MTAVLVPDGAQSVILETWEQVATEIGRGPSDTIHWKSVRSHPQRLHLCDAVRAEEDLRIVTVVFSKWDAGAAHIIRAPDCLYTWALRLLVERLSWFGKHHQGHTLMHFAQVKGVPPKLIADYLSGLQRQATNVAWGHLAMPAKVDTPHNQRMLQIADTASGAVYAAFEWDEYGNTERRYLDMLHTHLWRPRRGALQDYGLKVCPWPHPRHSWVVAFCRRQAKRWVRAVGRVAAVSLSPATDGVPEPTFIIPDPGRKATSARDCHRARATTKPSGASGGRNALLDEGDFLVAEAVEVVDEAVDLTLDDGDVRVPTPDGESQGRHERVAHQGQL
jgi:hypothetical protein